MTYTKPRLREKIKAQVVASSEGGKPGQWSARKAQLVARKYEAAGGGYKGRKTAPQRSLTKWTSERWTTSDRRPALRADGSMRRYLPEKAWIKLTPNQRAATNRKKAAGSKAGRQFVPNTQAAKDARKNLGHLSKPSGCSYAAAFKKAVNMTPAALRAWMRDPRAREASLPKRKATGKSAIAELAMVAKMLKKSPTKWSKKECVKARDLVNFVGRHRAQARSGGKFKCSRKRVIALRNWAHQPRECGIPPRK